MILSKVGRWAVEKSSGKHCLSSCKRQENPVEVSYNKFPNEMFLQSPDVLQLIIKLFRYCDSNKNDLKRPQLDARYPDLCPLLDIVGDDMDEDMQVENVATFKFYQQLNLNDTILKTFKKQLMLYASENLVKINAFLDSPHLSKFETDEVK